MSFHELLAYGEHWERIAIKKLNADAVRKIDGKFSYFDYVVVRNGAIELVEVKADRRAILTGNIAVEFFCSGVPSGLSVTKADYWLIVIPYPSEPVYYKVPVSVLKEMRDNQLYTDVKCGGIENRAIMYLFNKCLFESYKL